jgi:hypothetical protein
LHPRLGDAGGDLDVDAQRLQAHRLVGAGDDEHRRPPAARRRDELGPGLAERAGGGAETGGEGEDRGASGRRCMHGVGLSRGSRSEAVRPRGVLRPAGRFGVKPPTIARRVRAQTDAAPLFPSGATGAGT